MNGSVVGTGGLAGTGIGILTIFGLSFSQVRFLSACALILFIVGIAFVRMSYRRRRDLTQP